MALEPTSAGDSSIRDRSAMPDQSNGHLEPGNISQDLETNSVKEDTSTILHGDILKSDGAGFKTREVLLEYLIRQHGQLKDCYVAIRLSRGSVKEAWERFRRFHQAYQEARWLYDGAIDPVSVQYAFPDSADRMNSLRQGLTEARDSAEQQFVEAKDQELQFKLTEERLERKQDKFLAVADRFMSLATTGPADDMVSDFDSEAGFPVSPLSVRSAASRQMDPRQKRYYESASDVKLMNERLIELNERYREARVIRGMRQDQDEELSVTDSDFEAESARKRIVLENELYLAMAATEQLHAECMELGLEIDPSRPNTTDTEGLTGPSTREDSGTQYEGTVMQHHPPADGRVFSDIGESRLDRLINGHHDFFAGEPLDDLDAVKGPVDISGWMDNVDALAHGEVHLVPAERLPVLESPNGPAASPAVVQNGAALQHRMKRRASEPEFRKMMIFMSSDREAALKFF